MSGAGFSRPPIVAVAGGCAWLLCAVCAVTGCSELINPWSDSVPEPGPAPTASARVARRAGGGPVRPTRGFDRAVVSAQSGEVSHYPLWMQDPYEEFGSDDGRFAWTWEDYVGMPYGLSRFIVNTIGVPISAALYPPVPLRGSDGVIRNEPHDARWLAAGGTTVPPDWLEVGDAGDDSE